MLGPGGGQAYGCPSSRYELVPCWTTRFLAASGVRRHPSRSPLRARVRLGLRSCTRRRWNGSPGDRRYVQQQIDVTEYCKEHCGNGIICFTPSEDATIGEAFAVRESAAQESWDTVTVVTNESVACLPSTLHF